MRYLTYSPNESYGICILTTAINKDEILKEYVTPFDIDPTEVIVIAIDPEPNKKKSTASYLKRYAEEELEPVFESLNVQYAICADADLFKVLTGSAKADAAIGYVLESKYGNLHIAYVPSHKSIFYNPEVVRSKIALGINAVKEHAENQYIPPGTDIIKIGVYPKTYQEIKSALEMLVEMDKPLTIDIEAFSLKHYDAGIGTIAFAWDEHSGVAFPVDYEPIPNASSFPYGNNVVNEPVRQLLKDFFVKLSQKQIYHNISYDVCVLIYQLFMKSIDDNVGLLNGLDIMLSNWDDTKLITYLATNSCAGNKLGLKEQAQEFAGNYGQEEIKDITKIPLDQLLTYNLVDCLSTWFVYNKHNQTMIADQQEGIYQEIFKPAIKDIIQMQLTGMPINMDRVLEVEQILQKDSDAAVNTIQSSKLVQEFTYHLNEEWVRTKNETYKKKRVTLAEANEVFNPNSDKQLGDLLYNQIGLPVIELTKGGSPAVDGDTIEALLNHTSDPEVIKLLDAFLAHRAVDKILSVYIPAFKSAQLGSDGWHYLSGNFNLGGTVSGRLSSSKPNLQNIPAGSKYGKLIKSCFQAPPGWVFVGLDFASLEDRISALTTKDKNKLKVYLDGFDGHCLRAYSYFGDRMPDIVNTVESINSIKDKYSSLRNQSKAPTFLKTYGGTYIGLIKKCGFSKEMALQIDKKYHELYKESDEWVANKLKEAAKVGYVTVAFGLKVRTPLLSQVLRGTSKTPFEAEAEGRTAGNALGQSWGLLNTRAASEFLAKVRNHEDYKHLICPCAHIHDAQYYLVKDDVQVIRWMNEHLVIAVEWQEAPEIQHPDVKLGGELDLFWPSWADGITIPNHATEQDIINLVTKTINKRKESSK